MHKLMLFCRFMTTVLLIAQLQSPREVAFEVASIKLNHSANISINMARQPGGRFIATGVPLKLLIVFAQGIPESAVVGGPSWMESDRWDIEARAPESSAGNEAGLNTPDDMPLRMQSLLRDRFHLAAHREVRELPILAVVAAKNGPKLKLAENDQARPGAPPPNTMAVSENRLRGHAVALSGFAKTLSSILGRTVIDKTRLEGAYDIQLQWEATGAEAPAQGPEQGETSTNPSLVTALQEQLGLQLESSKGPVEVLVIDHVERPSEN